jgi:transcriptional regulator with XRE-family HTH domain
MADTEPPPAAEGSAGTWSLAEKIDHLFETVRRKDGSRYSNEDVAAAIRPRDGEGPTISGSYIWMLRRGDRDNPTKKHLEALAKFFGVPPAYFFDEAESTAIANELVLLRSLADAGVKRVAARLGGLSDGGLRVIADVVERIRASEGLPPHPSDER